LTKNEPPGKPIRPIGQRRRCRMVCSLIFRVAEGPDVGPLLQPRVRVEGESGEVLGAFDPQQGQVLILVLAEDAGGAGLFGLLAQIEDQHDVPLDEVCIGQEEAGAVDAEGQTILPQSLTSTRAVAALALLASWARDGSSPAAGFSIKHFFSHPFHDCEFHITSDFSSLYARN
jgi:hypothetical protein